MKKIFYTFLTAVTLISLVSCETTELDLLEDPTQVSTDQLDPQFLFNNIQFEFNNVVSSAGGFASFSSQVTRQFSMTGSSVYESSFSPTTFNGVWINAYAGLLQDVKTLEEVEGVENYNYHVGVSKVMKAYTLFTLVDLFGDVPYDEALLGAEISEPRYQNQIEVYEIALTELAAGRALLIEGGGIDPLEDFYYGVSASSLASWITAANTIELRALNNARLANSNLSVDIPARITSLINENNLIDAQTEDLQFNYVANRVNPDSRHPAYAANYENGATGYLSNYFMWQLVREKGFDDPRTRYYFYRQDSDASNEDIFTLGCAVQSAPGHYNNFASIYDNSIGIPFCNATTLARGYWGRDHGDDNGIPPDAEKRTVWGAYPAGGLFDANQSEDVQENGTDGLLGAGIQPVILSSFTQFMKAEIALELGIGDAATSLEAALDASMEKVLGFGNLSPNTVIVPDDADTIANEEVLQGDFFPSDSNVDSYIDFVMDAFTSASNDEKLNIIMKEFHIASFGNGMEAYNAYRRTGLPNNMQPSLNPNPGEFYRAAYYPANSINNNTNANSAEITRQIFWDTNPAGFIN